MATNFPNSPSNGATHVFGGTTYTYNSTKGVWKADKDAVAVSDTPPSNPETGALWFDSSVAKTYIYYNDGSSSQWVQLNPSGGSDGADGADATGDGESPIIYTEPPTSHTLNSDGTTSTIQMQAVDPEGTAITYGIAYANSTNALPDQLSSATTIDQTTGTYTFTPTTNTSNAGTFKARLSASDGITSATRFVNFSIDFWASVSGGTVTTVGGYNYYTFTSSSSLTVSTAGKLDYLVVAGGGGGGGHAGGGGGGAGGVRYGQMQVTAGTLTVTVGNGGTGGPNVSSAASVGSPGQDSVLGSITASGGGGGTGAGNTQVPAAGGSGGGGCHTSSSGAAGNAGGYSPVEGYAGGSHTGGYSGGGGGGAGAMGVDGTSTGGGDGGAGYQWLDGNYYGGGGGGGSHDGYAGGSGGTGGGAAGAGSYATSAPTAAAANTGGGGGGAAGRFGQYGAVGGDGGSGIVIVRVAV